MIDQIVNFVIRPPRAEYTPEEGLLGPTFTIKGRHYQRHDLELVNARGHLLQCSHYVPRKVPAGQLLPCVIYCHGNSGCRADASEAAVMLLPSNITVFAVDFAGSGMSGGEYVTLGHYERDDVTTVVDHLRVEGRTSLIGLWGRSMGAVTALMYGSRDPSIAGMVLDSPFANLHRLILELVDEFKIRLPKFGVKLAVQYMRRLIRQKASFDIQDLDAIPVAGQTFIPVLIGHAEGDAFIPPQHSDDIHEAYAGDKNLIKFEGDHNSPRPTFFYDSVTIFFHNVLKPPELLEGSDWLAREAEPAVISERMGARRHSQDLLSNLADLGIDLDDDAIDQATLYELLGMMGTARGGGKEEAAVRAQQPRLSRSHSELGRGQDVRPNGDTEQRLDQARSQWHMTSTVVPLDGEEEGEVEARDDLEKILESQRQIRATLDNASSESVGSRQSLREATVQPMTEQDEEQMLMAAIALSLQDQHQGNSSLLDGHASSSSECTDGDGARGPSMSKDSK